LETHLSDIANQRLRDYIVEKWFCERMPHSGRIVSMRRLLLLALVAAIVAGCQKTEALQHEVKNTMTQEEMTKNRIATFAGGCFWCVESDFEKIPGVVKVVSGYTGGNTGNPSYQEVTSGTTGHFEAVQVYYDPAKVTYEDLLGVFWRHIDPTDAGRQFVDRGPQYRSVIFYHDEEQRRLAEKSKADLNRSGKFAKPVVTDILKYTKFYEAEEYHQGYSRKNPLGYQWYRMGSGRDQYLCNVWGTEKKESSSGGKKGYTKPDDTVLKKKLTPLQYEVTQKDATEPPFQNEYWNDKREGIYVYCINSAALRFVPKEDLEKEGYGEYLKLFSRDTQK